MQVRQHMDLDQRNGVDQHHPVKKSLLPQKRSNRAFGMDLTNQRRQYSNQIVPQNKKFHASKSTNPANDGFNIVKKPVILQTKEEKVKVKSKGKSKTKSKGKSKRKVSVEAQKEESEAKKKEATQMDCDIIGEKQELSPWDIGDINNDLFVTDYVDDILSSLRSDEDSHRGIIENEMDFMTFQKDINARMRVVLVDWLIEVHRKFKLLPSTYFLGINLLDRYLAKKQLHRRKLQLCGCTCLWIASKYHEIFAPEMDDFVYISDNAFDSEDLMTMEVDILKALGFILTVPTVLNYGERYAKISSHYLKKERETKIISDLIMYCIEHSVMSYKLCRKVPSLIGASCFVYSCLSTKVFSFDTFANDSMDQVIGYSFSELVPIMIEIDHIVRTAKKGKHKAVYKKYCNAKYSNIGKLNFDKLNTDFLHEKQ